MPRDASICAWTDTPGAPPCGQPAKHWRHVRLLTDSGWAWTDLPLCATHYARASRSADGTAYPQQSRMSREAAERAREMVQGGATHQEAADALGVSRATISRLSALGWTLERYGPPQEVMDRLRRLGKRGGQRGS
jgi:hypothetical protein